MKSKAVPRNQGIRYRHTQSGAKRYEVRYRDPKKRDRNGRLVVRGKTFPTLEEAKRFQRDNAVAIQNGSYISREKSATTWARVSQDWLEANRARLRQRTQESYEGILGRWLDRWDGWPISKITADDVRTLLRDIRKAGRSPETEHRIFDVVSGVFAYAIRNGYLTQSPAQIIRAGKELRSLAQNTFEERALTQPEADAVIAALPHGRYQLYGLTGLWTGFRAGELAGLRVRNLDRLRNTITVDETVQRLRAGLEPGSPKTVKSRGRQVPVPAEVMQQLGAYVDQHHLSPDDYLFGKPGSDALFHHANYYRRQWRRACTAAGLPGLHFKALRKTFGSLRAAEGIPPNVLMAWMGHTSIQTTMKYYAGLYDDDPRHEEIIRRLYESSSVATPSVVSMPGVDSTG